MTALTVNEESSHYTYADYLQTSDDECWELIEGKLTMTPSPITKHQRISRELEFLIYNYLRDHQAGEVFDAPYDVVFDNKNVFQPDLIIVLNGRKEIIKEKNIQGAPDIVIEILSESTSKLDAVQKKNLYARFGVTEYWIVDGGSETIELNSFPEDTYRQIKMFSVKDTFKCDLLDGFKFELADVFKKNG